MSILNKFFKEKELEQNVQTQNQIKTKELSLNGGRDSIDNSLLNLMQANNISTTIGKFNKDISERLLSAFEKANLPENDFFEFCKALQVSDKNGAEKFSSTK